MQWKNIVGEVLALGVLGAIALCTAWLGVEGAKDICLTIAGGIVGYLAKTVGNNGAQIG